LLIEPADVSVCIRHPGFDVDLIVSAEILAFYRVWLGRVTLSEAVRKGQVELSGTPADIRAFRGGSRGVRWQITVAARRLSISAPAKTPELTSS